MACAGMVADCLIIELPQQQLFQKQKLVFKMRLPRYRQRHRCCEILPIGFPGALTIDVGSVYRKLHQHFTQRGF